MEKQLEKVKITGVSFAAENKSVHITDGRTYSTHRQTLTNRTHSVHYGQLLETPNSPGSAMEFLSRSWSPSASSFLQMFSSSDLQLPTSGKNSIEDHEVQLGQELKNVEKRNMVLAMNNSGKMNLNHVKGWLKGKPVTGFFRTWKEKRKEEIRFHTANLHAALSLTKLAASIASFASSPSNINHKNNMETRAYGGPGNVVATAATLLTTVCAEAAESFGADRSQVTSAINSGLAISNPIDMMAVTATAATSLRGAEILKSRMVVDSFPRRVQETPRVCSQICIITPSGVKEYKYITMYSKHKCLVLCLRKKYFGGTLTSSKEYKVFSIEDTMEGEGHFFLNLKTHNGTIKLLFEDENELRIWISTISNLLKMHNPSHK